MIMFATDSFPSESVLRDSVVEARHYVARVGSAASTLPSTGGVQQPRQLLIAFDYEVCTRACRRLVFDALVG